MPNLAVVAVTFNFLMVFAIGASVGSFLNVCAYRIPYERSFLWPGSRCGSCYQPVRWYDNLPLLSYWLLRGRCRTCGARFSVRYFLVELGTALAFAGLYYLEIYRNVLGIHFLGLPNIRWEIEHGVPSLTVWSVFAHHATLMSFLIAASLCDLDHLEIPLGITVAGTIVGLIGSAFFPWPFPNGAATVPNPIPAFPMMIGANPQAPSPGLYAWPVWFPFPKGFPAGSWQLGLLTGLAGAAAGNVVLRMVRFLFGLGRGIEGLGIGDSDLMMMAGSFVGWQVILVAFAAGVFPALVFGILQAVLRGKQAMPFGPSLAVGVMVALLWWYWIAPRAWLLLSDPFMLAFFGIVCPVMFVVIAFGLRIFRGPGPPDDFNDPGKCTRWLIPSTSITAWRTCGASRRRSSASATRPSSPAIPTESARRARLCFRASAPSATPSPACTKSAWRRRCWTICGAARRSSAFASVCRCCSRPTTRTAPGRGSTSSPARWCASATCRG